ncbi:MAG: hypothetical protein Kow00120_17810 [Anaerolineae bacterium]
MEAGVNRRLLWVCAIAVGLMGAALPPPGLTAPQAMAQGHDACTPEGVVEQFWAAFGSGGATEAAVEAWVQTYTQGACPDRIKDGARALADNYLAMLAGAPDASAPPATIEVPAVDPVATQVVTLLNAWRVRENLWPLRLNDTLTKMAEEQARYLQALPVWPDDPHRDGQGRDAKRRARAFGWPYYDNEGQVAADEIAYVGVSPNKALDYWKNSATHRGTVINPAFREVGVATASHPLGRVYIVVVGSRPNVLPALVEPEAGLLYLSTERYDWAGGDRIQEATRFQVLAAADGPPASAWTPWQLSVAAPQGTAPFFVLYSDGSHEVVTEVRPTVDVAWLPDVLSSLATASGESGCTLTAGDLGYANVREQPILGAPQVGTIYTPTQYAVDRQTPDNSWLHIAPGWVARRVVALQGDCGAVPTNIALVSPVLTAPSCHLTAGSEGFANIRQAPSAGAAKVNEINGAAEYSVIGQSADRQWFKIDLGWVAKQVVATRGECGTVPVTE